MANFNYNKVILGGRLTADPELKMTPDGVAVTSFSVAVSRPYSSRDGKYNTDFIHVVAWRNMAEFVTKYFRRGSSICITGRLQLREWTDKQGAPRHATEVVAESVDFVDSRSEVCATTDAEHAFEELSENDDLPF